MHTVLIAASPGWLFQLWWKVGVFAFGALLLWMMLRPLAGVLRMRAAVDWTGSRTAARAGFVRDLLWHFGRVFFLLFCMLLAVNEVLTGHMGSGVHHGPMDAKDSPAFFYAIWGVSFAAGIYWLAITVIGLVRFLRRGVEAIPDEALTKPRDKCRTEIQSS